MRLLLLLVWFLFVASAMFWLPAYEGEGEGISEDAPIFIPVFGVIFGLAAIGIRGRLASTGAALRSALPALVLLGAAAVWGVLQNESRAEFRGGPVYLYVGVAVWASWAVLMVSTALLSRTKWDGFAGVAIGLLVAFTGFFFFIARID